MQKYTLISAALLPLMVSGFSSICLAQLEEEEELLMDNAEWQAQQAAQAKHQRAIQAWMMYDQQTCGANAEHEARLYSWREACEAWNLNPDLPTCGPRPQLIMPYPPSMPRPASLAPLNCF